MDAVILAGGFGTRIRPLTYTRPKPLLPLLNRPLLAHILDRMPKSVRRIVLPVGYLKEQMEAYFEDHPDPRVALVTEDNPLGTGGAVKNAQAELKDAFFVYNGDIVCNLDLNRLAAFHKERKAEVTISLWPVEEPWHFGVVEQAPDGRIKTFVEKPPKGQQPTNLINAGHYLLERRMLDEIAPGRMFSMERELFTPMAQRNRPIYGMRFEGYWIDCGRPEQLLEAHAMVLRDRGEARVIDDDAKVESGAHVSGYAIAEGCHVGSGARIERSVLLPGVQVGKDVTIRDSILGEGVEVEDGATLERVVVGDYGVIQGRRTIHDQKIGMRLADLEA